MSQFVEGFSKTAGTASLLSKATRIGKQVASGAAEAGKSMASGAKKSMGDTVGSAMSLKGLKHIPAAIEQSGGLKKSLTTSQGRKNLAAGVGRAAPSIAVGGAYTAGLKKIYDKTLGSDDSYVSSSGGY